MGKEIKDIANSYINPESKEDIKDNSKEVEKTIHESNEIVERVDVKLITENGKQLLRD